MKNQKLISRNVIRKFLGGADIRIISAASSPEKNRYNYLPYIGDEYDTGDWGRFKIIEKVDTVIPDLENGYTYYGGGGVYYKKEDNGKIYRVEPISGLKYNYEIFGKVLPEVNKTANMVLSLANLHKTTRRLSNRNLSTNRTNTNVLTSGTNNNLSPWSSNINTNTLLSPWSKTKNPNVKLSPWSTNLNNQQTQKSNNLSNSNLSNIRTSGNIFSQQHANDGKFTLSKVKNFRDNVIDYQNSHSIDNDIKFTIPLGNVSINENDLLIRQIIPDIETRYTMPKSLFNITRNSVSSTPTLVLNSNLPHVTVPSLADVKYTPRQTTSSITTTSSSTLEPKLFTIKEKDFESKFNRKDIEDELVFMNLLTKDEAKNKSDEEILSLFLDYINKNIALLDKEPPKQEEKKEETKTSSAPIIMNREDVRNLMRYYGVNPYNYTGNLRKALRKYLNKEDNQLYEDWMAPFVVFKKKGGLLSRNTITRFKNKI